MTSPCKPPTKEDNVRFVTIEKIQNGFVITLPEFGDEDKKWHKHTINGVLQFLCGLWGLKKILFEKEQK